MARQPDAEFYCSYCDSVCDRLVCRRCGNTARGMPRTPSPRILRQIAPNSYPAENNASDDTGSERSEHRDEPKPPTSNLSGEAG